MSIEIPKNLAVTGRIKDWLKNPEDRLPVSCTVFDVQDSMEGENGIEESWLFASGALRNAAGVAINLSNLRPKGTKNGKGLTSSGPVSFAHIYSTLNEILRRGGTYKNGAVTLYLDYDHPDAEEYLNLPAAQLPWAKKALYVDQNLLKSPLLPLVIQKVSEGSIWLAKKNWDKNGNRLFSQVCLEILLQSRGTCLLSHVNLGATKIEEIPQAFENGMKFLCSIHPITGVGESGLYLHPQQDRQVGLGVLGLANLLAIEKISYLDFVLALEWVLHIHSKGEGTPENLPDNSKSVRLALALKEGFDLAANVAREGNFDRAFTIAPTATCSYKYRDRLGYTTAPEISAPITKVIDRDSGTFGVLRYEYPPNIEIASQVGWEIQYRLMKAWQGLMNSTGLAHAISFNIWDLCEVNKEFIADWLASPLQTTYYRLNVRQDVLNKAEVVTADYFEKVEEKKAECTADFCVSCAE